ncbi:TetR/AcrR family transcriptional regulator [Ruegeria sp. 2205SS24-7]|uniref:TetR/AcrR family transcriptional regulator n=1 Tax=Ruegeria discodermiae TaxID=3064389 RepID=UPI00274291F1|nr:TetR/AcrR family transcriptional regulator [Ruegeria sp. 2205SS24-7]MDP5220481.1 TetR/AcrR family transcriptional regulator [Ruegeria sp. 2205SS24-7]
MKDLDIDPKQKAILEAAWTAFATYGYRKTSMDDIARGAGMSRAAVYLQYRNKDDIFQTLVRYCYDMCAAALSEALSRGGAVSDVLEAAFLAQSEIVVKPMLSSAHGMELLEAGTTTSSEAVHEGEAKLREIYVGWLNRLADEGAATLPGSAEDTAALITSSLKGAKMTARSYEDYCRSAKLLAVLLGTGITK